MHQDSESVRLSVAAEQLASLELEQVAAPRAGRAFDATCVVRNSRHIVGSDEVAWSTQLQGQSDGDLQKLFAALQGRIESWCDNIRSPPVSLAFTGIFTRRFGEQSAVKDRISSVEEMVNVQSEARFEKMLNVQCEARFAAMQRVINDRIDDAVKERCKESFDALGSSVARDLEARYEGDYGAVSAGQLS